MDNQEKKAALTISIQSWATPIVGLILLFIGLAAGYWLRPVITPEPGSPGAVAAASTDTQAKSPTVTTQAQPAEQEASQANPEPTSETAAEASAATSELAQIDSQEKLAAFLAEKTRHFLGDPDAPVTIIEFSDFQ